MTNQSAKEQVREIIQQVLDTVECNITLDVVPKHACCYPEDALYQALSQIEEIVLGVIDTKLPNEDKMLNTCKTAQYGLRAEQLKRWSDK